MLHDPYVSHLIVSPCTGNGAKRTEKKILTNIAGSLQENKLHSKEDAQESFPTVLFLTELNNKDFPVSSS